MEPYEPKLILVPMDFSETAAHALRYASALGERFGAHLLVIHACEWLADEAREELQARAEQCIGANVAFDLRVITGEPLAVILVQVRESGANLVVMGTHGRTGLSRLMFGSVTESVVRFCTVPVIAVNSAATETGRVGKILCPVTFTPACRDALQRAAALVDGRGAPLVLFRPIDEEEDGHVRMHDLVRLQKWLPRELVDRCEMKLISAPQDAEEIVRLAKAAGADLIAIGVRAGSSVSDSLRGTVAERVVQQSGCPVLTVNAYTSGVLPIVETRELVTVA